MSPFWLLAGIIIGVAGRIAYTYSRYKKAGMINPDSRAASYVQAANLDIDLRRAHKDEAARQARRNRR